MNYRQKILETAIAMSADGGFTRLTRDGVARAAGVADGMVNKCFGTVSGLRSAIIIEAIRTENLDVLGQGLAARYPEALTMRPHLKARALAAMGLV